MTRVERRRLKRAGEFLNFMLAVLGFDYPPSHRSFLSFQNTTNTFARYERLRQLGFNKTDALYRVVYG